MFWTSLSFSVTPLPNSHCGSKGVFHPQRSGLCLQLLLVKHVLHYLFACGHTLLNWGRKAKPRHWFRESSCPSRSSQGCHNKGSPAPAKSMLVQGLSVISQHPCTSLPRHPTVGTWNPISFSFWPRKVIMYHPWAGSCHHGGILVLVPYAEFKCRMRKERQERIFLCQRQGARPLPLQEEKELGLQCQVPLGAGGCLLLFLK